jgi:hypothetical protein
VADVQDRRSVSLHLPDVQPARLASPAEVVEDEEMLIIELDVLVRLDARSSHGFRMLRMVSAIATRPLQLPGSGPSTITYSISGSAHSTELKSPRLQAA